MRREPEQRFTVDILQNEFIWLETMVSNRSRSCRAERGTVNRINKPFYVIHCSFVLFVLSYCALFYSYDPDFFIKQWIDSWDDHHHVFRCGGLYAQECTRRTHTVSCGWTNVHDMMRNESYTRTQRIWTSTPLHAQCSYKNCAATASLLLGIFFGLIIYTFLYRRCKNASMCIFP